ncbi:MAG TPA: hypothetical protein VFG32_04010 [Bacteroidota bacterium]|nr:hypothetical protein [Bacteroidota bacterium]
MNQGMTSSFSNSLEAITASAEQLQEFPKSNFHPGDCLIVKTFNSTYVLRAQDDGSCLASGGWFDRKGPTPMRVHINGCTWGGCVIKVDIVAALGLCLEFGNRVTTSPIQKIIVIPRERQN